ncbi:MAG: hypothetical protein AB1349_12350 [Elusimicrobiota bacterium]
MFYIKSSSVRKKAKQFNKRVSTSFLSLLDQKVDRLIETAIKNANNFKTLTRNDLF